MYIMCVILHLFGALTLSRRVGALQISIIINIIIKVALAGRYNFLLCMLFSHSFTQKVHFALPLVNTVSKLSFLISLHAIDSLNQKTTPELCNSVNTWSNQNVI